MSGWSLFVRVGDEVTEHPLGPETRVGRGPECQVRIRHPHVSKHHFTIHLDGDPTGGGGARLEHAHPPDNNPRGSWVTTRVYVNGVQIAEQAPLGLGDIITIKPSAESQVTIEVGPSRNPAPAAEPRRSRWRRR